MDTCSNNHKLEGKNKYMLKILTKLAKAYNIKQTNKQTNTQTNVLFGKNWKGGSSYLLESPYLECGVSGTI